jgi:aminoglycoside/choline kinase family phosphotransferase
MDLAQTRHVLLVADPGPVGLRGTSPECTVDEAKRALRALAGMHAKWWNSDHLKSISWLGSADSQSLTLAYPRKFRASWDAVKERFEGRFPDGLEEVGDRYGPVLAQMMQRSGTDPVTLVHGDFRPENLYFDDEGDGVTAVTWQLAGRWHGASDVSYFIPYAFTTDDRRANEQMLLRTYHDALVGYGVGDYSYDQFLEHYRQGLLRSLALFVIGDENIDLEVSEGETWNTRRVDSLQAIMDWNCIELLPERE